MPITAVHPRGRGEHTSTRKEFDIPNGSSPRTRGTLHCGWRQRYVVRFIPADAGNTRRPRLTMPFEPVHPRGRGEHDHRRAACDQVVGSSPRTRGTLYAGGPDTAMLRFIPADAGNTICEQITVNISAVHPRGRGEHG